MHRNACTYYIQIHNTLKCVHLNAAAKCTPPITNHFLKHVGKKWNKNKNNSNKKKGVSHIFNIVCTIIP